ncbi:MAG: hypothetical protein ACXVZ1_10040, partial [Gaiellaceae bacterium]
HAIVGSAAAASDTAFRGTVVAAPCGGTAEGFTCASGNDTNHVFVATQNPADTATADHSFYVIVFD